MEGGWKSRLSNVNAAFLNVKFKTIKTILRRREQIVLKYNKAFKDLPIGLPHEQEGRIWQEMHLRLPEREKFAQFLKKKGVETLTRDSIPNHKMMENLRYLELPVTERLAKEVIRLPLHEHLTDKEVAFIIHAVKSYFKK